MRRRRYPSDLTDPQWALLVPHIPPAKAGGRPRTTDMRAVLDAILYLLRTGCQWRQLPADFPPWPTVHGYFRRWRIAGFWTVLHRALYPLPLRRTDDWPRSGTPPHGTSTSLQRSRGLLA
jgi:putative transposase